MCDSPCGILIVLARQIKARRSRAKSERKSRVKCNKVPLRLGRARQMQWLKLRQGLKWLGESLNTFTNLLNLPSSEQAQSLLSAQNQVADLLRIELHEPATGGVHCEKIRAHDQCAQRLG